MLLAKISRGFKNSRASTPRGCRDPYRSIQIPTPLLESSLRVIVLPSLVCPYFELDNEQDEVCKASLIKK